MKNTLCMTGFRSTVFIIAMVFLQLFARTGNAQVSITGTTPVTQNFNTIGSSATATLPSGFRIGFGGAAYGAAATATAQSGGTSGAGVLTTGSTGGLYNFASGVTASSTDRAIGWLSSGSLGTGYLYMLVTNNSTAAITGFTLNFDYEKYRSGSRQFDMAVQGSTDGVTFGSAFASGTQSYPADANNTVVTDPPPSVSKSVTITGLNIPVGGSYYVRWSYIGLAGSSNGQGIGIDNISIAATFPTPYYSTAGGDLDNVLTWGINTDGSGTHPGSFTADAQTFNIANSNTGNIAGSSWTVSGTASKIFVSSANVNVASTKPIVGTMSMLSGSSITLQSTTIPTFDAIDAASTITYKNGTGNTLIYALTYGNVALDGSGTSITNPASVSNFNFAGNLTLRNSAVINANKLNLVTKGSSNQTITGNSSTFTIDSFINTAANSTGTLTFAANTPMTVVGSIKMDNTGAANAFIDGGNTLTVNGYSVFLGSALGYTLTGTINSTPSAASFIMSTSTTTSPVATLANVGINATGFTAAISGATNAITGSVNIVGTSNITLSTTAITVPGDFTVATGTTSVVTVGTLNLGGNYNWQATGGSMPTTSNITFNGTAAQTYSTAIAAGQTYTVATLNNSAGLTSSSLFRTPSFVWTAGNLATIPGTSTTAGPTYSVTAISGSGAKIFLGGGTWNGTSGLNGGVLKINTSNALTGGITVGSSTSITSSGILDLPVVGSWNNVSGNNIVINANSQLNLTGTHTLSAINLTLNGNGNNAAGYGVGALRTNTNATTLSCPITLGSQSGIYAGGTLTLTGIISGTGGIIKSGVATTLSGANTYSGANLINSGALNIASTSNIGTGSLRLAQIGSGVAASVAFNNTQTIGSLSDSFDAAFPAIAVGQTITIAANQTLTVNQTVDGTFGDGAISTQTGRIAGASTTTLIKSGSSKLSLTTSSTNAFVGALNITAGELNMIPSYGTTLTFGSAGVTLSGTTAKLSTTNITTAPIITMGGLAVTANATIDLGTATAHTLKFASAVGTWSGTLTITNWQGDYAGGSGTAGKIVIGANATAAGANLANIKFVGVAGTYDAAQLSTGEIVPKAYITTGAVSGGPVYSDATTNLTVAFTYTGPAVAPGTVYTAEVSDNTGSFAAPIATGTGTSSPISITIPSLTPVGTYYVRVNASAPVAITGSNTSFAIIGHPPVIASVIAYTNVLPGGTITITGTNFNIVAGNNMVFFGPVGVTPSASSYSSLTVTVPAGASAGYLTVTDTTTHLSANSSKIFIPTYKNTYFNTGFNFETPVTFSSITYNPAAANPFASAVGDFDGDGDLDVAVVTGNQGTAACFLVIYKNVGANGTVDFSTSTFEHVSTTQIQGLGINLKVADFDGDGKPDIAIDAKNGSSMYVVRNITSGFGPGASTITFDAYKHFDFPGITNAYSMTVGDFDKDGKIDIAEAAYGGGTNSSTLLVFANNCTKGVAMVNNSSFVLSTYTSGNNNGAYNTGITAGDFNADTMVDLAMINQNTSGNGTVTIFANTSSPGLMSFTTARTLNTQIYSADITSADFNGDGAADIAVTNQYSNSIQIYTNPNNGTFLFPATASYNLPVPTNFDPGAITVADMNGDSKPDILSGSSDIFTHAPPYTSDSLGIWLNTSSGSPSFAAPYTMLNGTAGIGAGITVADIDKDKYPDLIVANLSDDAFSLIRNKPVLTMGTISGSDTICHSSSTTLTYSNTIDPDLSYAWVSSDVNTATIDPATGVVAGVGGGPVTLTYSLTVTGTNISNTVDKPLQVTVVDVTPVAPPIVCIGVTSASLAYNTPEGSPIRYNVDYDATANSAGFIDVVNSSLPASPITLTVPVAPAVGVTYHGAFTVTDGTCVSDPHDLAIVTSNPPTASVMTTDATPCSNHYSSLQFTGTPDAYVTYTVDGGSGIDEVLVGGTYAIDFAHVTDPHSYTLVNAHDGYCTTTYNTPIDIVPVPMTWLGGLAGHTTDWNYAGNWSCGTIPSDSDNVTIPVTSDRPQILASASGVTHDFTLISGAAITLNTAALLNVKGAVVNNGATVGAGSIELNGSSAQTLGGVGNYDKLALNNTSGATMVAGTIATIKSTLTVTAGTLTTNDSLRIYSDSNGSARIAEIPSGAAIAGKVRVYQYIQGNYRRFRFWSHPFSTNISLSQLQNTMDITGVGGAANGFTTTGTNAPSAFWLDPKTESSAFAYNPGWKPFTKIDGTESDTNKIRVYQGIRLFFRGKKSEGLWGLNYTPSPNTVYMEGPVNQGDQAITMTRGTVNPTDQDYNLLGNPYPSPVEVGTAIYNAYNNGDVVGAQYFVFNASLQQSGAFVPLDIDGAPYNLQTNSAFEVRTATTGSQLHFTESMKRQSGTAQLFKQTAKGTEHLSLNIYDANYHPWDVLNIRFNNAASNNEDIKYDAVKPSGAEFNFYSLSADNKQLVLDARPFAADNVIPLGVSSPYRQDFIIKAENVALASGNVVVLNDKLLNKSVELSEGTEYKFTVSKDKATQGNDRFELSMKPAQSLANSFQVTMTPNPTTDNVKVAFTSDNKANVNIRVMDMSGVTVYNNDLGQMISGNITVPMTKFAPGVYMIELISGDHKSVQKLIKE